MRIRAARADDAAAVADIYNAGMRERSSTFETRERDPEEMAARIAGERHPFLVAELDGRVAGFAATAPYSDRDAYAGVVECSVYVDQALRGRGVGTALLAELATEAGRRGFHKLARQALRHERRQHAARAPRRIPRGRDPPAARPARRRVA